VVFSLHAGALFGAIASVEVLCVILGALIFNTIYSKTLDIASGFVFLVMAIFYAVSCVLLLSVYICSHLKSLLVSGVTID